jgi:hypothetical protein
MIRNFSGKFIRNKELPICSKCVYFIPPTHNYPFDPIPRDDQGQCKKFGEVNVVSGATEYDLASVSRLNESRCGQSGSEYQAFSKI